MLELSFIQSPLLWGECNICTLCCMNSQSLHFSFLVLSGAHHCWLDRGGMTWKACPTPLHLAGWVTRALATHPSANRARGCLTSVIWRELVTNLPCATIWCCICVLFMFPSKCNVKVLITTINRDTFKHDHYSTVGGDRGCTFGEVRAGSTSSVPHHSEIHPLYFNSYCVHCSYLL